jgi:uncharacterized membrane protein YphA (DoxX/SURF4 family)
MDQEEGSVISTLTKRGASTKRSIRDGRYRRIVYWAATAVICWELLLGGVWDILRIPYVYDMVVADLGYPEYFLVILGVWKLLGGVTLLAPRFPRLKEWAYAGAFFNYSGAVASHMAVGDGVEAWWGPAGFAVILMVSWWLRPTSRRDLAVR